MILLIYCYIIVSFIYRFDSYLFGERKSHIPDIPLRVLNNYRILLAGVENINYGKDLLHFRENKR